MPEKRVNLRLLDPHPDLLDIMGVYKTSFNLGLIAISNEIAIMINSLRNEK